MIINHNDDKVRSGEKERVGVFRLSNSTIVVLVS